MVKDVIKGRLSAIKEDVSKSLKQEDEQIQPELATIRKDLIKRVEQLEKNIESREATDIIETREELEKEIRALEKEMQTHKYSDSLYKRIEEDKKKIDSLYKQLSDIRREINQLKNKVGGPAVKELKLDEHLEDLIKKHSTEIVLKNLEKFAETLDKKLPQFVTQEEIEKLKKEIRTGIKDPSETIKRIDKLETQLELLIKNMYQGKSTIPVIVE